MTALRKYLTNIKKAFWTEKREETLTTEVECRMEQGRFAKVRVYKSIRARKRQLRARTNELADEA